MTDENNDLQTDPILEEGEAVEEPIQEPENVGDLNPDEPEAPEEDPKQDIVADSDEATVDEDTASDDNQETTAEIAEDVSTHSFSDALDYIQKSGEAVRRKCWPEDKCMCFEKGRYFVISKDRGKERVQEFDLDTVTATDWVQA